MYGVCGWECGVDVEGRGKGRWGWMRDGRGWGGWMDGWVDDDDG